MHWLYNLVPRAFPLKKMGVWGKSPGDEVVDCGDNDITMIDDNCDDDDDDDDDDQMK